MLNGTNNSDRITGKGGDGRIRGRVGNTVTYSSRIENIRGGSGNDLLYGCSGQNLLSGGGNSGGDLLSGFNRQIDILADLGRYNQQGINLPASNDVYTGFKGGSATWVLDTGGREDVVNLGNFSSSSVERLRVDIDGDGINGSLLMLFDDTGERGMLIINQFETDETGFLARGHIEKIKFKNTTISPSARRPLRSGRPPPQRAPPSAPRRPGTAVCSSQGTRPASGLRAGVSGAPARSLATGIPDCAPSCH